MKPKWIIEDFHPDNKFDVLAQEVKQQGMECEVVTYTPFQSGSYDIFKDNECVIFQGSINLALQFQRQKKWLPGCWLTPKNYECTKYYSILGKYLFNEKYVIFPRSEVVRKLDWLYNDCFGKNKQLFFRPNSGLKPFTAELRSYSNFVSFWSWVEEFTEPESLIIVSTPKSIKGEWRFVCTKDNVITGCQYQISGEHELSSEFPEEARKLAKEISNIYQPDSVFIVDICLGEDDKFYLMEIGSFSVAGLYACNMKSIVQSVSEIAVKEWEEFFTF